jgi:uncharacterized protein (DUF1919 family)
MSQFLNTPYKDLIDIASANAQAYKSNRPFPNISFDNFFNEEFLENVLSEFPDLSKKKTVRQFDNLKEKNLLIIKRKPLAQKLELLFII